MNSAKGHIRLFQEMIVLAVNDYVRGELEARGMYPSRGKQAISDIRRNYKSAVYFLWGDGLIDWVETTGMEKYLNIYAVRERAVKKVKRTIKWLKQMGKTADRWGQKNKLEKYLKEMF